MLACLTNSQNLKGYEEKKNPKQTESFLTESLHAAANNLQTEVILTCKTRISES